MTSNNLYHDDCNTTDVGTLILLRSALPQKCLENGKFGISLSAVSIEKNSKSGNQTSCDNIFDI